jgi:hypothetical protein
MLSGARWTHLPDLADKFGPGWENVLDKLAALVTGARSGALGG